MADSTACAVRSSLNFPLPHPICFQFLTSSYSISQTWYIPPYVSIQYILLNHLLYVNIYTSRFGKSDRKDRIRHDPNPQKKKKKKRWRLSLYKFFSLHAWVSITHFCQPLSIMQLDHAKLCLNILIESLPRGIKCYMAPSIICPAASRTHLLLFSTFSCSRKIRLLEVPP